MRLFLVTFALAVGCAAARGDVAPGPPRADTGPFFRPEHDDPGVPVEAVFAGSAVAVAAVAGGFWLVRRPKPRGGGR